MTPPPSRRTRTAEVVRGLGALAVLVALVAGLPAALLTVAGSPIPHRMPSWDQITTILSQPDTGNTLFLAVVKVIGWAAWCLFTLTVLTETIAYRRGRPSRRLPGVISPVQHLARDLIAMTALLISATAPALSAATPASASSPHTAAAVTVLPTPATVATLHTQHASARRAELRGHGMWRTRVIKRGDTLWAIARSATGSGTNYPALFKASTRLAQPHGLPPLTDPDRIYPGQHIKIPPRHDTADGPGRPPRQEPPSGHPHPPVMASPPTHTPHGTASATPLPPNATTPPTASRNPAPPARPEPTRPPASPPAASPGRSPARPRTATSTPTPADTTPPRTPPSHEPGPSHHTPVTVTLPTGAYLGLGLAAAISIALAATRLHRRRRRATTPGWPDRSQPTTPATIATTRKAHLDTHAEPSGPPPTDAELLAQDATEPAPTHITAGTRDTGEVRLALSGLKLALTGPGATATARALATELLGRSRRDRAEVLIPEPDAAVLLASTGINPGDLARDIPGLNIVASLQAAITHLEAEFIHRARLMETSGEPDIHALRRAEPGEPLPTLILIAQLPPASDALDAILAFSAPYGLGAILLGAWTTATTITVAADGTVTDARGPHAGTWTGSRLFHLGPSEAAEMLQVIRTAHGAPEPPTEHPDPSAPTPPTSAPAKPRTLPTASAPASSRPDSGEHDTARPVQLHVLGAIRLQADGQPISTGLRRITRDLLTYLALHPDGITRDQAVDALMPDRDLASGTTMIHTAINNARKTLRHSTGLREAMFIIHADGRYRLDAHLIDVDLWHLHAVLDRAHHAETDSGRINELRHIPDLYTAELAEDLTYEWAETERENLRRHATDALRQLAQLTRKTHPDRAIAALETAINHDPYAEPLYRDLMRIQAATDRPDAVRRTYDQLKRRLADLDTEPDDQTHQLLLALLRPSTASRSAKTPPSASRSAPQRHPAAPPNGTGTVRPLRPHNPE